MNDEVSLIVEQMNEPRALPIGMTEFEAWADRIILGAMLPEGVGRDGLIFTLSSMILSLGPTESHKPDAHFIHGLRKAAANQIAHAQQVAAKNRVAERMSAENAKVSAVGTGGALSLVKDSAVEDKKL